MDEYTPLHWQNPLNKVKTPKRPQEPLQPIAIDDIKALLDTCPPRTLAGDRDRAMILFLLDTGVRHQELTDLSIGDVNLQTGSVLVRCGKGRKPRTVFIDAKTRRALHRYLHYRDKMTDDVPLWVTLQGEHLTKGGTREVIRRRAKVAGIKDPAMHTFRSKRPLPPWLRYLQAYFRKAIETTGSLLERLLPKSIHAVTAVGFELKVVLFVLALSISRLPL
jgi:site-specific recombinase XerD